MAEDRYNECCQAQSHDAKAGEQKKLEQSVSRFKCHAKILNGRQKVVKTLLQKPKIIKED